MSEAERWLPVVGYEGLYEVSSLGRVYSHRRRGSDGRILKPKVLPSGHLFVGLNNAVGVRKPHRIHALVAAMFIAPPSPGLQVRHLDGDPTNNGVSNLAYGTNSENQLDSVRHGTHVWARKTHCPQGHPYDDENTYVTKQGRRMCWTCIRRRRVERRDRLRILRGPNAPKTHCPHGHAYDEENTYIRPDDGSRGCRKCRKRQNKESRDRLRARAQDPIDIQTHIAG